MTAQDRDPPGLESVYDREIAEEELWFLPEPAAEQTPGDPPWALADRQSLTDPTIWVEAEARQGRALARAAAAVARLDEYLALTGNGAVHRLALQEAADIAWATGGYIGADRLAVFDLFGHSGAAEDSRDLARAYWICRRLSKGPGPTNGLKDFLGLTLSNPVETVVLPAETRPTGEEFAALEADWQAAIRGAADLHPLSRAAYGFHVWRLLGLSAAGDAGEAALAAAKLGADGLKALPFLPVSGPATQVYRANGPIEARLSVWLGAIEAGANLARQTLERLYLWRERAVRETAALQGKVPGRLIDALISHRILSADMAADLTEASRAAVRRNLNRFEALGLIREVTGHQRFRFWAIR